jgi:hypothetical protein
MSYGRYSKGQRVKLREATNELHYSADVMRLIGKSTEETPEVKKRPQRARTSKKPHGRVDALWKS